MGNTFLPKKALGNVFNQILRIMFGRNCIAANNRILLVILLDLCLAEKTLSWTFTSSMTVSNSCWTCRTLFGDCLGWSDEILRRDSLVSYSISCLVFSICNCTRFFIFDICNCRWLLQFLWPFNWILTLANHTLLRPWYTLCHLSFT